MIRIPQIRKSFMSASQSGNDPAIAPVAAPRKSPNAFNPNASMLGTLVMLWPYLWPSDRRDLQIRVMIAFVLILIAKLITISVPFTFKWATDALVAISQKGGAVTASEVLPWIIGAPVIATILYGLARVGMALFQQLRDGNALHASFSQIEFAFQLKLIHPDFNTEGLDVHVLVVLSVSPSQNHPHPSSRRRPGSS